MTEMSGTVTGNVSVQYILNLSNFIL